MYECMPWPRRPAGSSCSCSRSRSSLQLVAGRREKEASIFLLPWIHIHHPHLLHAPPSKASSGVQHELAPREPHPTFLSYGFHEFSS
jgi:hypothetical protein